MRDGIAHAAFALLTPLWESQAFLIALGLVAKILGQVVFVAVIALFMTLCWTKVAATQFAIYMSLANLSRTIGSALFALVAAHMGYSSEFIAMAVLLAASAAVLLLFDGPKHKARLGGGGGERVTAAWPSREHPASALPRCGLGHRRA